MRLCLMRHGLANWPTWAGRDEDRPLTPLGVHSIQAEGAALARLDLKPDLILHSPLARAAQTARLVAEVLGLPERVRAHDALRPGFDDLALSNLLREYAALEELMLVGHAPDVAQATEALTNQPVKFKEGTVALIKIDKPDAAPTGALVWLATAEKLISG